MASDPKTAEASSTGEGVCAASVGQTFEISCPLEDESISRLGGQVSVPAKTTEAAFARSFLGAFMTGEFVVIRHGTYNDKPACLICIDTEIQYSEDWKLENAGIQLRFTSLGTGAASSLPRLAGGTGALGPECLEGPPLTVVIEKSFNAQTTLSAPNMGVTTPSVTGQKNFQTEKYWSLTSAQGLPGRDRVFRTGTWKLQGSIRDEQKNMPRKFRIGVIVEHGNEPFGMKATISGTLFRWREAAAKMFAFGNDNFNFARQVATFQPEPDSQVVLTDAMLAVELNVTNSALLRNVGTSAPQTAS